MNSIAEVLAMSIGRALNIGGTLLIKLEHDFNNVEAMVTCQQWRGYTISDLDRIDHELAQHDLRRYMQRWEINSLLSPVQPILNRLDRIRQLHPQST